METAKPDFGLAHLWASGDFVSHSIAILIVLMSIFSWTLIIFKIKSWWQLREADKWVERFWNADSLENGLLGLQKNGLKSPYYQLALSVQHYDQHYAKEGLAARFDLAEQLERALRQRLASMQIRFEKGLTFLATVGATAPFVGLFGTVWGIYHALVAIGASGQAALEKIAGPVGEALIMTAAGLAVALPAVFAYNTFVRANRISALRLENFAHDLHMFMTMGKPLLRQEAQMSPTKSFHRQNTEQ